MLGVGFYLTQKKFLGFFPGDDQQDYPPHYRRFWAIAGELLDPAYGVERTIRGRKSAVIASKHAKSLKPVFADLRNHYADLKRPHVSRATKATPASTNASKIEYLRLLSRDVIERTIGGTLTQVTATVRAYYPTHTWLN